MRLLVADDDPSLRTALRMVLEESGHEVVEASTTAAARSALAGLDFDFIIIDAGMDGRGTMLWTELTAGEPYRNRALLVTGDLPALGALGDHEAVLEKPFDFALLVQRIEEAGSRG